MAPTKSLQCLLRVLVMEEEQAQAALESAIAKLNQMESWLHQARERERMGRKMVALSAYSGDPVDRMSALEQIAAAECSVLLLRREIAQHEMELTRAREEFLAKRRQRRQTETLVAHMEEKRAAETRTREQQATDDSYLNRHRRGPDEINVKTRSADGSFDLADFVN